MSAPLSPSFPSEAGLYQAAAAVSADSHLHWVCTQLAGQLNRLMRANRTVIYLVDHARAEVRLAAGAGDIRPERDLGLSYAEINAGLGGQVWRTGQPVLSLRPDDGLEPPAARARRERDGAGALLIVPLYVQAEVVGVVTAINQADQPPFSEEDLEALMTLASLASASIENVGLAQVEQQRRQLAEALERSGRELARSLDVKSMPERILRQAGQVAPYDQGLLLLNEAGEWGLAAYDGFENLAAAAAEVDGVRALFQPALASGQAQVRPAGPFTWLGDSLMIQGRVAGLLALGRVGSAAFGEPELETLSAFTAQAASALENARLYNETARFSELMERMVSERVAELHNAIRLLEQVDKTKSRFIEVTAHELRTPLTLVKGYGAMLASLPVVQSGEAQPLMAGMVSGVNRLHDIINSMLDVAKIDSQSLNMRRGPTLFGPILRRVQADYQAALRERRLTCVVRGLEDLPLIEIDSDLIHKAFNQLFSNAIKYTPDGGTITLEAKVLSAEHEPAVELVLSDTGVGIDPEYQALIFEKFYQLGEVALHSSGRTKFKGGGPGLGLAIVSGIVRAHGGTIWVESPGHDEQTCPGSAFHILLPLKA